MTRPTRRRPATVSDAITQHYANPPAHGPEPIGAPDHTGELARLTEQTTTPGFAALNDVDRARVERRIAWLRGLLDNHTDPAA